MNGIGNDLIAVIQWTLFFRLQAIRLTINEKKKHDNIFQDSIDKIL